MAEERKRRSRTEDVPPAPTRRNYAARPIAGLLAPVLRPAYKRRAPAAANLLADWEEIAGPGLAARAAPIKFAGGTLTLACSGPVAMELQLLGPQIIERLNQALGHGMIERLRFQQSTPRAAAAAPPSRPESPVALPENLPEGALGEALAALFRGLKARPPKV